MPGSGSDQTAQLLRRVKSKDAEPLDFVWLMQCLMEKGNFRKASQIGRQAIERFGTEMQDCFENLGVCEWVLDQPQAAVQAWRDGLNCSYRDTAGGLYPRLLLWFAGVVTGDQSLVAEAVSLIKHTLQSPRAVKWPGVLGRYVLGQASQDELWREAVEGDIRAKFPFLQRKALFFVGVIALVNEEYKRARGCFRACTHMFPTAFENDLYLARHEQARLEKANPTADTASKTGAKDIYVWKRGQA
jgi:hypothetical protein